MEVGLQALDAFKTLGPIIVARIHKSQKLRGDLDSRSQKIMKDPTPMSKLCRGKIITGQVILIALHRVCVGAGGHSVWG